MLPELVEHTVPTLGICVPIKVLSVYNGDTVVCETRFRFRLRLIDAWAPEVTGPQKAKGLKAKAAMQKLCEGKIGTVLIPWQDDIGKMTSMGRILGSLNINGDDIAYEMRKTGWAKLTKDEAADAWPE